MWESLTQNFWLDIHTNGHKDLQNLFHGRSGVSTFLHSSGDDSGKNENMPGPVLVINTLPRFDSLI